MNGPRKILVFHTAFPGDIVLTVPVLEALSRKFPEARISAVVVPSSSDVLLHHPAIDELIVYDKRGLQKGVGGIISLVARLKQEGFDLAVVPHRSIRSALIVRLAFIPRRIGFSTSAGHALFTDVVEYTPDIHEIQRNLSLLRPLGLEPDPNARPTLYPDGADRAAVDKLLGSGSTRDAAPGTRTMVALAPGSVWNTKRWPQEYYARLGGMLVDRGVFVLLIGGEDDCRLCEEIDAAIGHEHVLNAAGRLTLLQSAELIRRCSVLVSNDSAPVHLAVAMGTPVIAIFGPTVPAFGFAPQGLNDEVIEQQGLGCRPCSIHGGDACPIKTFVCMKGITPDAVYARVLAKVRSAEV